MIVKTNRESSGLVRWAFAGLRRGLGTFVSFDKRIPADPGTHKLLLAITAVLLILPFFISLPQPQQECLYCAGWKLPGGCLSQRIFHTPCPGCGMTHAFVCLTHGQFRESLRWNRMGILLYVYFLYQAALRIRILQRPASAQNPRIVVFQHYASWTMIVLLIGNWAASFWLGQNGS